MWNKDSARRSSLTTPRVFPPSNAFPPSPRQFPPPSVSNSAYTPPHRPFFRNTFSPVYSVPQMRDNSPSRVPQPSDTGIQSSFSFAKHALHRPGGLSPLSSSDILRSPYSSSEILRSPYSPGQYMTHQQNKPSVPSLEQLPKSAYLKTEVNVNQQFSFQNSPPPQIPFLSERKIFGGIPFISDATVDSSSPYSNHGISTSSVIKQEEDSLDYFYNKHTPSEENRESSPKTILYESTPSHSFEKGNASLDHSGFSQKSDDSYPSEGNCEPNVSEDSQSQLTSFPVVDSPEDTSIRKSAARPFPEDSHHGSGDSEENASKRHKLSHDLENKPIDLKGSELEKCITEDGAVIDDSVENSPKCRKPGFDTGSESRSTEKSELEKHITEVLEPVVGLDYLMEFKKENVPPSFYMYKCSLCKCSILAKHVLMHILSVKHRLRYLKAMDENEHQRIMKRCASQDELGAYVSRAVTDLEIKHGRGSVKVVCVPSSETKNSEENFEDSFNISPTLSTPSIVPPSDDLLLDKIPEPPDIKLLNDILSTAQTLRGGVSEEFFRLLGAGKKELQKEESPKFKAETTGSNWQLECEIPPPPPLPFTEGTSSPWNQARSPTPARSPTDAPQKHISSECGRDVVPMDLAESPVKNENPEVTGTSSTECSVHTPAHHVTSETTFPSNDNLKLKNVTSSECKLEVLQKIPLIDDTADDNVENSGTSLSVNVPSPFNKMPAEGAMLTEEEEELGKAAIFEHLSLCTITNEAEASLVERIICTLSEMYFAYKLKDLPKSESESLLQALHLGEKEGIEKLTSILYRHHHVTDDSLSESDGIRNSSEEHSTRCDDHLSPLQSIKTEECETDKDFESGSVFPSTQEGEGTKSILNSSHSNHQLNKESINSPSSLAGGEAELIYSTKDDADAEGIPVKEGVNEKCTEGNSISKDEKNSQNLTFLQPPPPPPPAESASQISVSEQSSYSQASASYGGWPMAYYTTAAHAGGYMYWPSQNMGGVEPSVMNTQYMIPTQNSETSLYSWCQQAPPPLPPPPPPPPPPPTNSAP